MGLGANLSRIRNYYKLYFTYVLASAVPSRIWNISRVSIQLYLDVAHFNEYIRASTRNEG